MPRKRDYGQFCPVAQSLDAIGDRWTMLIVRELLVGPVRYGELLAALKPIATDVLARRLREMEATGLVSSVERGYDLTDDGVRLVPILRAVAHWGAGRLKPPESSNDLSAARALQWLILSGRRDSSEDARRPDDRPDREIEIRVGDLTVSLASPPDGYRARRRPSRAPKASVVTDDATLWAVLASAERWQPAINSGALVITGDEQLAEAMLAGRLPAAVADLLDR